MDVIINNCISSLSACVTHAAYGGYLTARWHYPHIRSARTFHNFIHKCTPIAPLLVPTKVSPIFNYKRPKSNIISMYIVKHGSKAVEKC